MSYELDYFPPKGTKWVWHSKGLTYSPWVCRLHTQMEPNLSLWPASAMLYVDLIDGMYVWRVKICDFQHRELRLEGSNEDPLEACLEAEAVGERELNRVLPDWAKTALAHGWRSPA